MDCLAPDFARRTDCLRRILDHRQTGNGRSYRVQRRQLPEQVHRHHGLCGRRHRGSSRLWGKIEVAGINVRKNRPRPDVMNCPGGREERERSRYHLVAAADVERPERQQKRIGAVRAANRKARPRQLGDGILELLDGSTKDERLVVNHPHHRADDVVANRRVLGAEI
jgi:hypothetical protein